MSIDSGDAPPPPPPPPPDYSVADEPVVDEGPAAPESAPSPGVDGVDGVDTAASNVSGTVEGTDDLAPADVPMVDDGQAAPDLPDMSDDPFTVDATTPDDFVGGDSAELAPGDEQDLPGSSESGNADGDMSAAADASDKAVSDTDVADTDVADTDVADTDAADAHTTDESGDDTLPPEGGIPDWTYSPDMATNHGRDSVEGHDGHGVNDDALNDAVQNPEAVTGKVDDQGRNSTIFTGKDATVVLNDNGQLVTAWSRNSNGYRYP